MRLLCIDPGVNTGWAYREDNGHVESGTQVFGLRRGESAGMRFIRFNRWLRETFSPNEFSVGSGSPQLIIYEQAHLRGGPATDCLVGMTTRLEEYAAEIGAEHKAVHTSTLKKAVAGNGRASKEDMAEAVFKELRKCHMADEHEIDALALLVWYDKGMVESLGRKKRGKP